MENLQKCKACGADIAKSAKACPVCGAKNKKPVYKKVWFWIAIILLFSMAAGVAGGSSTTTTGNMDSETTTKNEQKTVAPKPSVFDGDCGITASAHMGTSIIGFPELKISVKNTTDKTISAIQFYMVPLDVYGEEIKGWTSQNNLYTDTAIEAGKSDVATYQLIEDSVKKARLYVYSVYFEDGTEWGDKDATRSTILKQGAEIEVSWDS